MALEDLFRFGPERSLVTQEVFTDRNDELDIFVRGLDAVRSTRRAGVDAVKDLQSARRNVLAFHGMGGIGKTELSRRCESLLMSGETGADAKRTALRIDLADRSTLDHESTVLSLRATLGRLGGRWAAFDLAFAVYWERKHPGRPLAEFLDRQTILRRLAGSVGLSEQIQDALDGFVGSTGLVGSAWRAGEMVKHEILQRSARSRLAKTCPFFEPLAAEGDPDEALPFLPILLAWDLAGSHPDGADVVVFFDTWEELKAYPDERGGLEDTLSRIAYVMPNALFVVTGRLPLDWGSPSNSSLLYAGPHRWPGLSGSSSDDQYELHGLGAVDCDGYLRTRLLRDGAPAIPDAIRTAIAKNSHGLPIYLNLAAERYSDLALHGAPAAEDFAGGFPQLVTRTMRDLPSAERDLLRAAAMTASFDERMLRAALPAARDKPLQTFLARKFVQLVENGDFPFALQRSLRTSILSFDSTTPEAWSSREWGEAATRTLADLKSRCNDVEEGDERSLVPLFMQACQLASAYELQCSWLLPVVDRLAAQGLWHVLRHPRSLVGLAGGKTLRFVADAAEAKLQRAVGDLGRAQELLRSSMLQGELDRRAREWFEFQYASVLVMRSSYEEAEPILSRLAKSSGDSADQAARSLAMLRERRGLFRQALQWTSMEKESPRDQLRSHDLAGWVYLSCGLFERAAAEFGQTVRLSSAVRGPLLQNWAREHYAWSVAWLDAPRALRLSREVCETGRRLEIRTSIGRALSTMVVAGAGVLPAHELDEALTESLEVLQSSGFRADCLHPHVAETFFACVVDDPVRATRAHDAIVAMTAELGSHEFFAAVAAAWLRAAFNRPTPPLAGQLEWIDSYEDAMSRWQHVMLARRHAYRSGPAERRP